MSTCILPAGLPPATVHDSFYLGKPGTMSKLGLADSGFQAPIARAEVAHALAGGGTTTTRRRLPKRTYSLPFSAQTPDVAETLLSYYTGSRGPGPFVLVDPSYRNHLALDTSTFSAASGALTTWSVLAAGAQPYLDTAFAPPLPGSAVLHWPTPALAYPLTEATQPAAATYVPDPTSAVPYLQDLPAYLTCWVRTVTGTSSLLFYAAGLTAAGVLAASVHTTNAITTTWQQIAVPVPAGSWTQAAGPYIAPSFVANTVGGPDLLFANCALNYGFTNAAPPWVTGLGCPRVSFSSGVSESVTVTWRRDAAYMLSEA